MSLRSKTLLIIGLVLFLLVSVVYGVTIRIINSTCSTLETSMMRENMERVQTAFGEDLHKLGTITCDWAMLDDAYRFTTQEPDFNGHLSDRTFLNLSLNFVLFLDKTGQIIHGRGYDLQAEDEKPYPAGLQNFLYPGSPLLMGNSIQGVLSLPEGPAMVASRPVSDDEGPSHGTILVGRYIDQTFTENLSARTQLPVRLDNDTTTASLAVNQAGTWPSYTETLGSNDMSGFAVIQDLYGEPVIGLSVTTPRAFYQSTRDIVNKLILAIFSIGLFFSMTVLFVLERTVLSPMVKLSTGVRKKIHESRDIFNRLEQEETTDELSLLSGNINQMLAHLDQSRQNMVITENLLDLIVQTDASGILRYTSPSHKIILGYEPEEIMGKSIFDWVHPDDHKFVMDSHLEFLANRIPERKEFRYRHKEGHYIWLEAIATPVYDSDNNVEGILISSRDITARKEVEEQLRVLSLFDTLTGLYNRTYFEQEMRRIQNSRSASVGIIICDVDGLKLFNDSLGHDAGDNLLKVAANVLKSCFREEDMVARIGGDEFAIILPNSSVELVEAACRRVREAINAYNEQYPKLTLSISVGYAVSRKDTNLRDLFKEADNNMYREKLHRSQSARSSTVALLMKALEARDYNTEGHADRLQNLAGSLAAAIGLPEHKIADIRLFAQFHDIGKVGIPDRILFKEAPLNEEERTEMQRHCEIGHRIALSAPELVPLADWILKHHEWWDGQGYPFGLTGQKIPLECRILALADTYDAMTRERPYRSAVSHQEA
ncbi:MAG: diguanylate cyclase, partial [Bacillota bacterium]|nr:diguanylate cyclase [Bacillota bacterium]